MDRKEIEFSSSKRSSINVITGNTYSGTPSSTGPRLITIFHDTEAAIIELPKIPIPVLMVEVPKPFPYKSQKAIPWDYNCNYTHQTAVNDLTGVGGLTRSGRCYAPGLYPRTVQCLQMKNNPLKRRSDFLEKKRVKTSKILKAQANP